MGDSLLEGVAVAAGWRRSGGVTRSMGRGVDRYATSTRRAERERDSVLETAAETETETETDTEPETETETETETATETETTETETESETETAQPRRCSTNASARRAYSSRVE
jgi:hypothetical protein